MEQDRENPSPETPGPENPNPETPNRDRDLRKQIEAAVKGFGKSSKSITALEVQGYNITKCTIQHRTRDQGRVRLILLWNQKRAVPICQSSANSPAMHPGSIPLHIVPSLLSTLQEGGPQGNLASRTERFVRSSTRPRLAIQGI